MATNLNDSGWVPEQGFCIHDFTIVKRIVVWALDSEYATDSFDEMCSVCVNGLLFLLFSCLILSSNGTFLTSAVDLKVDFVADTKIKLPFNIFLIFLFTCKPSACMDLPELLVS